MNLISKFKQKSLILSSLLAANLSFLMGQTIPSGATISIGATGTDPISDWTTYQHLAKYVIGASLFVALIVVIYHVATNSPKAKTAIVSWVIAVVIYCIAINIFS